ncbi:MAG: hypothetical protein ACKVWV_11380 [Planctomycetota bacterium]
MERDDLCLLDEWISHWRDRVRFDALLVITSTDARGRIAAK